MIMQRLKYRTIFNINLCLYYLYMIDYDKFKQNRSSKINLRNEKLPLTDL
jgi:hypothetical protein